MKKYKQVYIIFEVSTKSHNHKCPVSVIILAKLLANIFKKTDNM